MGESRFRAVAKTVNHGWYVEYDDTGETVCDLYIKDGADIVEFDNAEANAHLIASAPDMASRIAELEAENARLRAALKPFSEVSTVLIDDELIGWDTGMRNTRISDWIGPSDLIAARGALAASEGES